MPWRKFALSLVEVMGERWAVEVKWRDCRANYAGVIPEFSDVREAGQQRGGLRR